MNERHRLHRTFLLVFLLFLVVGCSTPEQRADESVSTETHELTLAAAVRLRLTSFEPGPAPTTPTPREWAFQLSDQAPAPTRAAHGGRIFTCTAGTDCLNGGTVHSLLPGQFDHADSRFFAESYEYIMQLDASKASNTFNGSISASPPHLVPDQQLDFTLTISAAGVVTASSSDGDVASVSDSCIQHTAGWKLCWESDLVDLTAAPHAEFRLASVMINPGSPASQSTFRWDVFEGPPGRFPEGSHPPIASRSNSAPYLQCTPGGNCDISALGVGGTSLVSLDPEAIPAGDARFFPVDNKFFLPFDPVEAPVEFVFDLAEFSSSPFGVASAVTMSFKLDQSGSPIDFAVISDSLVPNAPTDWALSDTLPVPVTGNLGQHCLSSATRGLTVCFDLGASGLTPFTPPPGGARWLRAAQFKRTVTDMLGPEAGATAEPPRDPVIPVATVEAFTASVDLVSATQYERNSIDVAKAAVDHPTRLAELAPCVTQGPVDSAFRRTCYEEVAQRIGNIAYRLPPAEAMVGRLVDIGVLGESEGASDSDKLKAGLKYLIATILESPSFLYSLEIGEAVAGTDTRTLNPFELATRLALFLQGRGPSEELLNQAAMGDLSTPAGIRTVAGELLDTPEAQDGFADQLDELFQVKLLQTKGKDTTVYPNFSPALADSMREELRRFVTDIAFDNPRDFLTVLTDQKRFVNSALAQFVYQIPPPATEWQQVDFSVSPLNAQKRAGIMTMPAMMTLLSHPVRNSIVRRGLFANDHLFCQPAFTLPRVDTTLKVASDGTLREFMESVEAQGFCGGCHKFMNRLGYAFENFDAMGQFRTTEIDANGTSHTIDATSTTVNLVDGTTFGSYNDAVDWATDAFNLGPIVSRCWVNQIYRNAVGADAGPGQDTVLGSVNLAFGSSGRLMRELLLSFVSSPAFTEVGPAR